MKEKPKVGRTTFKEDEGTDKKYREYQITLMHECEKDAGEFDDITKIALQFFAYRCKPYSIWQLEESKNLMEMMMQEIKEE